MIHAPERSAQRDMLQSVIAVVSKTRYLHNGRKSEGKGSVAKGSDDMPSREQRVSDTPALERATRDRGVNHALKTETCRA
jgi:hypothetical protein